MADNRIGEQRVRHVVHDLCELLAGIPDDIVLAALADMIARVCDRDDDRDDKLNKLNFVSGRAELRAFEFYHRED